jgi:hypothetical protein
MIHARYLLNGIARIMVKTVIEIGSNHIVIASSLYSDNLVAMERGHALEPLRPDQRRKQINK